MPNKKILICEDNDDLAKLYTLALTSQSYELHVLYNANTIIRDVENFEPDLVIMDLKLPGISGDEAIRMIRNTSNLKHLAILMISANASLPTIAAECDVSYLEKPFSLASFRGLIHDQLQQGGSAPSPN